jgi:IS30 family transposase
MRARWRKLSAAELQDLWGRWKRGHTCSAIGEALSTFRWAVYQIVARHGGIAPPSRTRSPRVLHLLEREEISRGVARGTSLRSIARVLRRAPSTISREILRHGGRSQYRAVDADTRARRCAQRPKRCRLAARPRLQRVVAAKLRADWAPQQIAAWLVLQYPDDLTMRVSHETIYRTLYVQARGALKQELLRHLRRRRTMRRSGRASLAGDGRGQIVDAVSIAERPRSVDDRALPGHWEGDLFAGTKQSYIATLVERHSRYVLLVRLRAGGGSRSKNSTVVG